MHARGDVLCHPEGLHVGKIGVHLRRRLGLGRVLEDHLDAIDRQLLDVFLDADRRGDQARLTGCHVLTEPHSHVPEGADGQKHAVLEEGPTSHGVAGVDVLGDCEIHEVLGRDDLRLARSHVGLVEEAANPTEVIDVGVGVDHRYNGALPEVLVDELERSSRRFLGGCRVEYDPSGLALDEGNVGEVESTDLINARDHLVESEG